ncbi:major facilitator superfamily domain-containing protein [Diplogelasinospora grovesii]|uniref:Major facilitator superfamily domain-containing protein n=1 Tax=Diplogelasinospora grovesii TaxID=303347 RepID=A0AAN6S245_9PEZI|nr:major facilitator superfamily domain-containing protein [Diplogelasinospora grovesii]
MADPVDVDDADVLTTPSSSSHHHHYYHSQHSPPKAPPPKTVIRALLGLLVLVNLSWSLYQLPLNRVIERRLCAEYYLSHDPRVIGGDGSVPEELCKVDEIQQGLGKLQGGMETAWIVGDFIMTIPLVSLVDLYGRRAVLWLNLIPRIALLFWTFCVGYFHDSLPTNSILVAPLFSVLGGDCVFNSIVYALVASLTDDYVQRATYFGQMNAISSIFAFQLGPALASASMSVLLWLPFWIGIVLLLLAIPTISLLPWELGPGVDTHYEERDPLLWSSRRTAKRNRPLRHKISLKRVMFERVYNIREILTTHPRNFALLLCGFLLTSLASSDTKLLPQYISKRYEWRFANVGYLLSGKAVFNFILLTVIIPAILKRLRPKHLSPDDDETPFVGRQPQYVKEDAANFKYANVCLVFSVLGATAIGLAGSINLLVPSLLLYALGIALPMFTYSLLKSPAVSPSTDDETETQIFSIVMLVKTVGLLLGAPLMAALWVQGIGVGGAALGLPFFVSAGCYLLAIVVFAGIKLYDPRAV